MTETHDIFVRTYAGATDEDDKQRKSYSIDSPKWPHYVFVFDTETRITADQSLTFGVFRLCELKNYIYRVIRESLFYADNLPAKEREVLQNYARTAISDAKVFPPEFPLHSRSDFMKRCFSLRSSGGSFDLWSEPTVRSGAPCTSLEQRGACRVVAHDVSLFKQSRGSKHSTRSDHAN